MININFINNYDSKYDDYEKEFIKIAENALQVLEKNKNYEISVTLVTNNKIHEINREYRHLDRVTDVISFENDFEFDFEDLQDLGDIFISVDKALEQACEYQHSIERELTFLFVHGLLHCFGYDHLNSDEEEEMNRLQEVILSV